MAKKRQKQHETREEGEASGPIVVGIGASAGGVHALQELFRTMPADIGMAFVAIIHMKPDASSHLESVLRNVTDLRVVTIEDGVTIEANTIYVAPPGNAVETESNQLYLVPAPSEVPPSHVNHFFRSLAAHVGQRALGIVLSGMGTDGSVGLKEIKANLGITCVHDPDEAEYPSMPQSALDTGDIDQVLRLDEMAQALIEYKRFFDDRANASETDEEASQGEYVDRILALLNERVGRDFSEYKRSTVLRRIERRVSVHRLASIKSYLHYLQRHTEEAEELLRDLLIGVTSFFRDRDAFTTLAEQALPQIIPNHERRALRIWVVGCATGEEAYSIAMLVHEHLSKRNLSPPSRSSLPTSMSAQ